VCDVNLLADFQLEECYVNSSRGELGHYCSIELASVVDAFGNGSSVRRNYLYMRYSHVTTLAFKTRILQIDEDGSTRDLFMGFYVITAQLGEKSPPPPLPRI